ncbi:MAG: fluoride efflux transporter CrcB [Anaerolineales bacterium]|nr:fluoride efflux transporter CrcB [Anaerolineales bacterium]
MTNILLVGAGGFIGSVLRYLIGGYFQGFAKSFPLGTLAVNVIGCFIIGLLAHLGEKYGMFSNESRAFIFIGILGGFTTFSAFGNETINLMRQGFGANAFINIGANVVFGLLAVWLGRVIGHLIWR